MNQTETKQSELIDYLIEEGYNETRIDGYRVINTYTSKEKEIESLYTGAALRNISHYGLIELKGKDVLDLLNRISTNSTKDIPKGKVATTLFTTEKGRIIGLGRLVNFDEYQLLVTSSENKSKVASWIKKYVITDDVIVNDAAGKFNLLELTGPQADSFATLICGNVINEIEENSFKIIHTENILFFLLKLVDEIGNNKFWFLADLENSKQLINYMIDNKGPFDFNLVGEEAYTEFRILHKIPLAPNELNDKFNPLEAGLKNYIDFEKGCYIGQEVIARLDTYDKVQKALCVLELSEMVDPAEQFNLSDGNGNDAGVITSSAFSVKLNKPIALAYVRNKFLKDGTKLTAKSTKGKTVESTVISLPLDV